MPREFVLYQDRADEWRWRLVAGNGRIIADGSEGYASRSNVRDAVARVKSVAPDADRVAYGEPHFEVFKQDDDAWHWRLLASNGRIIAVSARDYASKSGARSAVDTARQYLDDRDAFEHYEDDDAYHWRVVATNGRPVADSARSYQSEDGVSAAIDRVVQNSTDADLLRIDQPHFEVYKDRGDKWRWRLLATNGRIIADSGQGYARKDGAVRAVTRLQEAAEEDQEVIAAPAAVGETLGVEAVADGTRRFEVILDAGRPVPVSDERTDFTTIEDDQTELEVRILAGGNDQPEENSRLGTFYLDDLPARAAGEPDFRIRFAVSEQGELTAQAEDLETGKMAETTVSVDLTDGS